MPKKITNKEIEEKRIKRRRKVIEFLRSKGESSITEISKGTGIPHSTLSGAKGILEKLREYGLLEKKKSGKLTKYRIYWQQPWEKRLLESMKYRYAETIDNKLGKHWIRGIKIFSKCVDYHIYKKPLRKKIKRICRAFFSRVLSEEEKEKIILKKVAGDVGKPIDDVRKGFRAHQRIIEEVVPEEIASGKYIQVKTPSYSNVKFDKSVGLIVYWLPILKSMYSISELCHMGVIQIKKNKKSILKSLKEFLQSFLPFEW